MTQENLGDFLASLDSWNQLNSCKALVRPDWPVQLLEFASFCEDRMEKYYKRVCPQVTDHGIRHLRCVAQQADSFMQLVPASFSEAEIFLLLAACWSHDIGMVRARAIQDEGPQVTYRQEHARHSKEYLEEEYADIGLAADEGQLIALLAWSHGVHLRRDPDDSTKQQDENYEDLMKQLHEDTELAGQPVRLSAIAAILKLADEIDLSSDRVDEEIRDLLNSALDPESKQHFLKHRFVERAEFQRGEYPACIEVYLLFQFPGNPPEDPLRDSTENNLEKWHCSQQADLICRWIIYESVLDAVDDCRDILARKLGVALTLVPWEDIDKVCDSELSEILEQPDIKEDFLGFLAVEGLSRSTHKDGSSYGLQRTLFNLLLEPDDYHYATAVRPAEIAPNLWRQEEWKQAGGSFLNAQSLVRYHQYRKRYYESDIESVTLWGLSEAYFDSLIDEYIDDNHRLRKMKLRIETLSEDVLGAICDPNRPMRLLLLPSCENHDWYIFALRFISRRQFMIVFYDGPVWERNWTSEYEVNSRKAEQHAEAFRQLVRKWYPKVDLERITQKTRLAGFGCTWCRFCEEFRARILNSARMRREHLESVGEKLNEADKQVKTVFNRIEGMSPKEMAQDVLGISSIK